MTSPALSVEGVGVSFRGLAALSDVSLAVNEGERRALIGPNGAGKTTLFNVIDGHIKPSTGRVSVLGKDVARLSIHRRVRRGLGRTYQITNLLTELSVLENVMIAVAARTSVVRRQFWWPLARVADVRGRAEELLRTWELWSARNSSVAELAYGQQRVLEIVMALAGDPKVLLLDEPTAGLSRRDADILADVVDALPASLALLVIEHDMDIAFKLCNAVTVLADGKVLEEGTATEIRQSRAVIETYLGEHEDVA